MNITAQRIRERRLHQMLSQEELADIINSSQKQVSKWELGRNDPSSTVIASIALALDTTTDYLVGLTDSPDRSIQASSGLSAEEIELVRIYQSKRPDQKRQIRRILEAV